MKLEEYGVSKFTARTVLLVIGLIAAVIIIVVINQTRSSSTTHVDGRYIPAKTQAGSNICNEGIDVDLLCIEFLIYEGIDDDAKKLMSSGIEAIASRYKFTEPELTVDWFGFGSEGGLNNYVGVMAWHSQLSDRDAISYDLCQFLAVSKDYAEWCLEEIGGAVLNTFGWEEGISASYLTGDSSDNGHLIMVTEDTFDLPEEFAGININDPRIAMAHEYFHLYQRVHTLNMLKSADNELPPEGPYWLTEGTAEYGSYKTASDEGWIDWDEELWWAVVDVKWVMDMYPDMALTDSITFSDYKRTQIHEHVDVVLYELGLLATVYAISLSSHDALMVDYYDDLEEYGAEKSFERNIGITFDEFHKSFSDLIQKDASEIFAVINPQSAFVPEGSIYDSPEVGPVQIGPVKVEPVEVDYTKSPNISNGILSLQATIQKDYSLKEIWLFYDGESQAINSEQFFNVISTCLYYSDEPFCVNIEPFTVVIPKPEKEYMHDIPEFRYDMLFTLTDMWTAIDGEVYVTADISDVMQGSGIYIVALMGGEGTLHFMESSIFKEKMLETVQRQVSGDSAAVQEFDQWMIDYELTYDIIDVHSIWVD